MLLATLVICGAFLLHFFLVFPRPHPITLRFPRLEKTLYVIPAAFVVLVFVVQTMPRARLESFLARGDVAAGRSASPVPSPPAELEYVTPGASNGAGRSAVPV